MEIYEVYDKYDDGLGHNLLALCYSEVLDGVQGEMEAGQLRCEGRGAASVFAIVSLSLAPRLDAHF